MKRKKQALKIRNICNTHTYKQNIHTKCQVYIILLSWRRCRRGRDNRRSGCLRLKWSAQPEAEQSLMGDHSNTTAEHRHVSPLLVLHLWKVCHFIYIYTCVKGLNSHQYFLHPHSFLEVHWISLSPSEKQKQPSSTRKIMIYVGQGEYHHTSLISVSISNFKISNFNLAHTHT